MCRKRILRSFLVLLVISLSGLALAEELCGTPRQAVEELIKWQEPSNRNLGRSAVCLDLSAEDSAEVGPVRARQILEVLNARGLPVQLANIPSDADYLGEDGRTRYVLFPRHLPTVYVERVGDRWLWSSATVASIPDLHQETFTLDLAVFEDRLPEWAQGRFLGVEAWKLLALLALILLAIIFRAIVMFVVATQAGHFMKRIQAEWGRDLLARIDNPIGTLAAAGFVALMLPSIHLPARLNMVSLLAIRVVAAFSAVWAVYRLVDVISGWLEDRASKTETKLDDQLVPLVRTSLKIFIISVGVVFVLQNLDVDVGGLLAGLGLGGLAFALAARDTVANLFGAVTVFLDKPFQIGDWIVVDGNHGVVEQVGFRSTSLRTFYNSVLTVPNSTLAGGMIDNYGARQFRRIYSTIGVTLDTTPEQMQAFVEGIRAIIHANPFTRKDIYEVHFNEFGKHSLDVMVYFFVKVENWNAELRERHNIFLEILRLAKELKVDFALPTQTLHVESLPKPGTLNPPRTGPDDLASVIHAFGPKGAMARPSGPKLTHGYQPYQESMTKAEADCRESEPSGNASDQGAKSAKSS